MNETDAETPSNLLRITHLTEIKIKLKFELRLYLLLCDLAELAQLQGILTLRSGPSHTVLVTVNRFVGEYVPEQSQLKDPMSMFLDRGRGGCLGAWCKGMSATPEDPHFPSPSAMYNLYDLG